MCDLIEDTDKKYQWNPITYKVVDGKFKILSVIILQSTLNNSVHQIMGFSSIWKHPTQTLSVQLLLLSVLPFNCFNHNEASQGPKLLFSTSPLYASFLPSNATSYLVDPG